jgi:hypothetical protein
MKQDVQRYLNDHLAGSSGALHLIDQITKGMPEGTDTKFFEGLKSSVGQDRAILEELISSLGRDSSMLLKAAGELAGRLGWIKLAWEGLLPGKLGMFEALELLTLGITGKHLLWKALIGVRDRFPQWIGYDFESLNREGLRQRDAVEAYRIQAASDSLSPDEELHAN